MINYSQHLFEVNVVFCVFRMYFYGIFEPPPPDPSDLCKRYSRQKPCVQTENHCKHFNPNMNHAYHARHRHESRMRFREVSRKKTKNQAKIKNLAILCDLFWCG